MITREEALAAVAPDLEGDAREQSADRIMAGMAANDAYWNSRSELERIVSHYEGHHKVVRGSDETPTQLDTTTGAADWIAPDRSETTAGELSAGSGDEAERLRQQLRAHGFSPEA